jgi:hypothetical protein
LWRGGAMPQKSGSFEKMILRLFGIPLVKDCEKLLAKIQEDLGE